MEDTACSKRKTYMGYIKSAKSELDVEFSALVSDLDESIQEIAKASRDLIYSILPDLTEVIWKRQRIIGYGTGAKKMSEHFCYIAPCQKHVSVGFNYGSELPDPTDLLEGSGALMRHIKIRDMNELDNPALRELIQYATKYRVPPVVTDN